MYPKAIFYLLKGDCIKGNEGEWQRPWKVPLYSRLRFRTGRKVIPWWPPLTMAETCKGSSRIMENQMDKPVEKAKVPESLKPINPMP